MSLILDSSFVPGRRVERFNTVVVGAGQAGLAVARELMARDVDVVVASNEARIGDNWRRRWDSLRLFTPAQFSGLPGMPFPAPPHHFPDKDEVADYLLRYAERFDIPVRTSSGISSVERDGQHFELRGGATKLEASNVVIATGAFQTARIPEIAQRVTPEIVQLHSSHYRSQWALPDGPVLVVGAGNSGAQIALELSRTRKVWLAGRDTGHLPRRFLNRDIMKWTWPLMTRATSDTILGKRLRRRARRGGDALIGLSRTAFVTAGITRLPRVDGIRRGYPVCGDLIVRPRVVIWATGFEPAFDWLKLPFSRSGGYPVHQRGMVAEVPGLYFVGLPFQYRLSSTLLGGVGADAEFVGAQIAARNEETNDQL